MQHDDQKIKDYGVKLAIEMIRKLTQGGIRGVHFCTLNLEKSVQRVLEGLAWAGGDESLRLANKLISVRYLSPFICYFDPCLKSNRKRGQRIWMRT